MRLATIKLNNTEPLGISNKITEDSSNAVFRIFDRYLEELRKETAVKNIIAQHQRTRLITNEILTYQECLCNTIRTFLHCI